VLGVDHEQRQSIRAPGADGQAHGTDWGDLDEEDRRENDYAVSRFLRIFSAYGKCPSRLWVITEAERSVTTILRPDEY
jgi:hypothetical protein